MRTFQMASLWLLVGVAALMPQVFPNPYYLHLIVVIGIYAILLFGMDILVGYTGEVSLGHAGLFAVGAYTAGLIATKLGLPVYLAMVTLAFSTIIQILINEMEFLTNGPQGLQVLKPEVFGERLTSEQFYYVVLGALVLSLIAVTRLLRSHLGRAS